MLTSLASCICGDGRRPTANAAARRGCRQRVRADRPTPVHVRSCAYNLQTGHGRRRVPMHYADCRTVCREDS